MAHHYSPYQSANSSLRRKSRIHDVKKVAFKSTTNPGQLQESTLGPLPENPDEGAPSTTQKLITEHVSPLRGRTMKEYDQQIAELKKENFNLKLRIYFLEDMIQHKFGGSTDDIHKRNIELKVEVESLKKEVANKQELIVKAANGLETLEATHKAKIEELQQQFSNRRKSLENQIAQLQQNLEGLQSDQGDSDKSRKSDYYQQAFLPFHTETEKTSEIKELESKVEAFQRVIEENQTQIQELQRDLVSKDTLIKKEEENSMKRNKMIQGLLATFKIRGNEIIQLQEKLKEKETEIMLVKDELQAYKEEQKAIKSTDGSSVETIKNHSLELEDPCETRQVLKEYQEQNRRLENALQEAHQEKEDICKRLQVELNERLQAKDEIIEHLNENINSYYSIFRNCFHLLGCMDTNEMSENLINSLTDLIKVKLKESDTKIQMALEENSKRLKEKDNELIQYQETVYELENIQKTLKNDLKASQNTIKKLEGQIKDGTIQELVSLVQSQREELDSTTERCSSLLTDKDAMISRLQKSLVESEKGLEETCGYRENSLNATNDSTSLQKCITEKDELIEELISDRNKSLIESERSVQSLTVALRDKDIALKEIHDRLMEEQNSRVNERDSLKGDLKKKMIEIENLENQIKKLQEQHEAITSKLQTAIEEKDKTIQMLIDSNAKKEREFQQFIASSPGKLTDVELQSMKEEVVTLQNKLIVKEKHLTTIKTQIKKMILESYCENSTNKNTSLCEEDEPEMHVEDYLKSLEEKFKASKLQNQKIQEEADVVRRKVVELKHLLKGCIKHEMHKGAGDMIPLETEDLQTTLNYLLTELKFMVNMSELLQRQFETNIEKKASFNPEIVIDLALQIDHLRSEINPESSCKMNDSDENESKNLKSSKLRNASTTIHGPTMTTQNNSKSNISIATLALLLNNKSNEIQILKDKLTGTESTVRLLGSKVKHYRRLLCDSGLGVLLTPSPSEAPFFPSPSCNQEKRNSQEIISATSFLRSRRSVSADDISLGVNPIPTEDNQALSAEDVLTTVPITKPDYIRSFSESHQQSKMLPSPENKIWLENYSSISPNKSVFEICLQHIREGTRNSRQSTRPSSLNVEQLSVDTYSPCALDNISEFGQSNDVLALKEQILWLKLHLEQCLHELQEYKYEKKLYFEKVDAESQTECRDDEEGSLTTNKSSSMEVQILQQQLNTLKTRLNTLLSEIPEGSHSTFIKLLQQEQQSLRNHLYESHESCEVLRIRLEELADFMEHLLHFDENGVLDISKFTPQRIACLQKQIAQSRELSHNLSQSLLVDGDVSVISSCVDFHIHRDHESTHLTDCSIMQDHSILPDQSLMYSIPKPVGNQMDNTKNNQSTLKDEDFKELKRLKEENEQKNYMISKLNSELKELKEELDTRKGENTRFSLPHMEELTFRKNPYRKLLPELSNCQQDAESQKRVHILDSSNVSSRSQRYVIGVETAETELHKMSSQNLDISQFLDAESSNFESHWKQSENRSEFAKQSESSYDDLILLLNNKSDSSLKKSHKKSTHKSDNKGMASSETNEMRTIAADQEQAIIAECVGGDHPFLQVQDLQNGAFNRKSISTAKEQQMYSGRDEVSHQRLKMAISPTDSESWSEPDRDVSQQRMGLEPEDGFYRSPGERNQLGRSPKSLRHKYQKSGSSNTDASSESCKMGHKISATPGGSKIRNDPWEAWRLQDRLQRLEEVNSSLRSELQMYHSLLGGMMVSPSKSNNNINLPSSITTRKSSADSLLNPQDAILNQNKTQEMLQEQLKEIRALRHRQEQSIMLRERLEKKAALQESEHGILRNEGESNEKSPDRRSSKTTEEGNRGLLEELQKQIKIYLKQKLELESEAHSLNQQIYELTEKLHLKDDQISQLQRNLTDRDDVGYQLKQANERLQNSLIHFQTSLNDKESVCKELREANSRMQRTLDAVDKLIAEKELQLAELQNQHLHLTKEMKQVREAHQEETNHLLKLVSDTKKMSEEKEKSLCQMNAEELQEIQYKHQEEIETLSKLIESKEKLLEKYEQNIEKLRQQLSSKEKHEQILQTKFDEMSAAILEMEKHLEEEHGQNLSLQQRVNSLNKALLEKDKNLQESLQNLDKLQSEMTKNHSENMSKIKELQLEVTNREKEVMEKDQQIFSLRKIVDKMQDEIAEKKKTLKRQLEMAQQLEQKMEILNCSATEKEQRCQEEHAVKQHLQEQIKSSEEEMEKMKVEMKKQQEHCKQLKDHLSTQEKKYLDLQNKLDERGDVIRKLEEELHQSWEENEKLQSQVISAQTMLHETNNLNKSMKTELHVYERLHSSFVSSTNDSKEDKSPTRKGVSSIKIEMLLDEIRSLRTQLELSIQTSCALRVQLESQFNSGGDNLPTKESSTEMKITEDKDDVFGSSKNPLIKTMRPTKDISASLIKDKSGLSKSVMLEANEINSLVKIPSVSTESGQFSDIESMHCNNDIDKRCSRSSDNLPPVPNDTSSKESSEVSAKACDKNSRQKIEKQKPSRLCLEDNPKFHRETIDVPDMHSVYSSPDLGIESDPSPFTCLESKLNHITEEHLWEIQKNHKKDSVLEFHVDTDRRLLYAIGRLDDYELLKKEVEECIVILKGLQSRVKERLHGKSFASKHKTDEVAWKEVQTSASSIDICLGRSLQVIGFFWTAMLPSETGTNREEIEKLNQENSSLKKKLRHQKRSLNDYIDKLAASNRTLEGMKKGITKQLLQTHDVLRKTKGNLQEQTKLITNVE